MALSRKEIARRYYARHRERLLEKAADRYRKDPEILKERSKRWREDNPEHSLLFNCRQGAKQRGHVCSLTVKDLKELTAPMVCSVTGLQLSWGGGPWGPSIDRKDNSIGYTRSNVRLVCWAFNSMRGEWDDETVLTVALGMASMHRGKAP